MPSATGNIHRDTILYAAIGTLDVINFDNAVAALPADFDLDQEEFTGAVKILNSRPLMIDKTPDGRSLVPPKSLENIEAPREAEDEPPHDPPAVEAPQPVIGFQEANDNVLAAHNALGTARLALRQARQNTQDARGALARSISIWQTGLPAYTREDLIRDHLRGEQERRRQRIEAGLPANAPKRVANSYLDRSAAYGRDNSAEGAARSRMQNGGRRGAFPSSMQHQINNDPRRGPVGK
jgi:hypothetical protein